MSLKKKTLLTMDERTLIIKMRGQGFTFSEIGKFLNRTDSTIYSYYRRSNGKVIPLGKNPIPSNVVDMYVKGMTIKQIMKKTGFSYGGIHRKIRTSGVKFRSRGISLKNIPDTIYDDYREGKSIRQLARELGCSCGVIRQRLVNKGIEIRSATEWNWIKDA